MKKLLPLLPLALLLCGCQSLISNAPQPILAAPGDYKVDKCPDLPPVLKTDEKSLVAILGTDAQTVGCLRGEVAAWISWDALNEKAIVTTTK